MISIDQLNQLNKQCSNLMTGGKCPSLKMKPDEAINFITAPYQMRVIELEAQMLGLTAELDRWRNGEIAALKRCVELEQLLAESREGLTRPAWSAMLDTDEGEAK